MPRTSKLETAEFVKEGEYYVFRQKGFESRSHESDLLIEKDTDTKIAYITFNRPDKHNALGVAGWKRLVNVMPQLEADDDVKLVIMRGAGEHFGSGFDAGELGTIGGFGDGKSEAAKSRPAQRDRIARDHFTWYGGTGVEMALMTFLKPLMVEAKGYCYGGHMWVCAYADIVIAREDAAFTHPAWRYLGPISPFPLMFEIFGLKKVKEMVFTNRPIPAREAEQFGMVTKTVKDDAELAKESEEYAAAIVSHNLDGMVMGKAMMYMCMQARGIDFSNSLCGYVGHPMLTNLKFMPEEWNFLKTRRDQGLSNAVDDVDKRYAERFSLRRVRNQPEKRVRKK